MRLTTLLLATTTLLPLSVEAVSLKAIEGRWTNVNPQCQVDAGRGEFCEFIIDAHSETEGQFRLSVSGQPVLIPMTLHAIQATVWQVILPDGALGKLRYSSGEIVDESNEHYRRITN